MSKERSFWSTVPGCLTGIAGLITAVGGFLLILNQLGLFPPTPSVEPTKPSQSSTNPTQPPSSQPTKFVADWGACTWVEVEKAGINSHQPNDWCSNGTFLVGLDLDRCNCSSSDSPVVGQARCCALAGNQSSSCRWVDVQKAGVNSHQPMAWCSEGSYLASLDFDGGTYDPMDSPVVGQAQCCSLPSPITSWSSCEWVGVHTAGVSSHQPNTWCPNGSFLVGLDLDREGTYDPMDSPVVGQAYCCTPGD